MLDSIFASTAAETLTVGSMLLIVVSALALGFLISLVYMVTHKKELYTSSFIIALIMLPAIIAMIILLVGNNVARAFSLAGAFSLIRFRSAPGNSKDIAYVFFTLGVGLACGMGYIAYAALFAVIMCLVMILLTKLRFAGRNTHPMSLKIVIPEHLDYNGLFDGVLEEYTSAHKLSKVKTTEYGSLFEITYEITLKNMAASKPFIDKLRCLNGNLTVILTLKEQNEAPVF
jgi:hypothetical protein